MQVPNKRGVKTPAGKNISSRNAVTHGMTSTLLLIDDESQADLDAHFKQWHLQYPATNDIAERLVIRAALSEWHLLRLERQFNAVSSHLLDIPITDWTDDNHALYKNTQRYLTTAQRAHHRDRSNLQQDRAQLRAEELHQTRMEKINTGANTSAPAHESPKQTQFNNLEDAQPPFDWPLEQDIILALDLNGQPWANMQPSTEALLLNTDDSLETRLITRRFFLKARPVAPGYEWVVDRFQHAPPGTTALVCRHTAKSFRIIAEREKGGPAQRWNDLLEIDRFILDNNLKGQPCQPRELK